MSPFVKWNETRKDCSQCSLPTYRNKFCKRGQLIFVDGVVLYMEEEQDWRFSSPAIQHFSVCSPVISLLSDYIEQIALVMPYLHNCICSRMLGTLGIDS